MGPPLCMRSVIGRNVVIRRMTSSEVKNVRSYSSSSPYAFIACKGTDSSSYYSTACRRARMWGALPNQCVCVFLLQRPRAPI